MCFKNIKYIQFKEHFANNSIFIKLSFSLKLNFFKIKFQNRGILLNSFGTGAFCYLFWAKGTNAHFGPNPLNKRNKINLNNNNKN